MVVNRGNQHDPFFWHSLQPCGRPRRHSISSSHISVSYGHPLAALSEVFGLLLLLWLLFSSLTSFFTSLTASHASLQLHEPRSSQFTSEKTTRGRLETKPWLFIARDLATRRTVRLPFQARKGSFGSSMILHSLSYLCHPGCLSWQNGYPLTTCPAALEGRTIRDSVPG